MQRFSGVRRRAGAEGLPELAGKLAEGLILVTSWPGQPSVAQLEREAQEGLRPRTDYVELARRLDADVVDGDYMCRRSSRAAQIAARVGGLAQGQVVEALLRGAQYRWILAWADHLGFRLATASKLLRRRMKLVIVSGRLATPKKRFLLGPLALHTQIDAIVNYSSVQREIGVRYGVSPDKLHLLLQPVDVRFWQPAGAGEPDVICAVGYEARDYETLLAAIRGLPIRLEVAIGSSALPDTRGRSGGIDASNQVRVHRQLTHSSLRDLYARSRVVVVPLNDVDQDAGVTVITEALAMGKPVIVTRTRGQVDIVRDGDQGILVPPRDPAAMRAALERLLSDGAACEVMGRSGRKLVCERHTLERYVAALAEMVARVDSTPVAGNPRRSPR